MHFIQSKVWKEFECREVEKQEKGRPGARGRDTMKGMLSVSARVLEFHFSKIRCHILLMRVSLILLIL